MGKISSKNVLRPRGRGRLVKYVENLGFHEVFSEGQKTEPLYIENVKEEIARHKSCTTEGITIHTNGAGKSTLSLIEYAEIEVQKRLDAGYKVDHVWIFYDKDDFSKADFDNAFNKIESKNKTKFKNRNFHKKPCDENGVAWHACWSNECFELWVLLHFQYLNTPIPRKKYIPLINKYIKDKTYGEYAKNNKHIYDMIKINNGSLENAISCAKKLDVDGSSKPNPSTGIYQLFEFLQEILKEEK